MSWQKKSLPLIVRQARGGNSVFVADYGQSTIQYISNKKASLTGLTVLDACAEAFDDNPVQVQLPYDEYYVFARLHGTPKNKHGGQSSVILTPNPVLQVCNVGTRYGHHERGLLRNASHG